MALGCRAVGFCRVFWKLSHTREHEENFPKNHTELYMAVQTLQDGARAKSGGSMKSIRRMAPRWRARRAVGWQAEKQER